jgi:rhamnulokinase
MSRLFVAVDLGEELGRVFLGTLHKGQLTISEVHRFHNVPAREKKEVLWDVAQLYQDTLTGLLTVGLYDEPVDGISCTSWGGDYLLFHADASFIPPTHHHTDPRTLEGRKALLARMSREAIYEENGRQESLKSTLYQLAAEKSRALKRADHLMPFADGFNFLLSGNACVEASSASATHLLNPRTRYWSEALRAAVGLPANLLPTVIPAATKLKPLRPELVTATRLEGAHIIASCSNELAAALASLPVHENEQWAFLRMGASATIGAPMTDAVVNSATCEAGLSHTLGNNNTVFGHLEAHGLQLLDDCRQFWAESDHYMDDDALAHLAATAEPLESVVDLSDPRFASSDDLIAKLQAFCRETDQTAPRKPGAIYRCLMESLAFQYRRKLDELAQTTGVEFTHLHLLGDSKNMMLNHFIANAVELPVMVAPANPAALGNILLQALAMGRIKDRDEANLINQQSFKRPLIFPNPTATWAPVYERLCQIRATEATPVSA